jgi:hypothetical protein
MEISGELPGERRNYPVSSQKVKSTNTFNNRTFAGTVSFINFSSRSLRLVPIIYSWFHSSVHIWPPQAHIPAWTVIQLSTGISFRLPPSIWLLWQAHNQCLLTLFPFPQITRLVPVTRTTQSPWMTVHLLPSFTIRNTSMLSILWCTLGLSGLPSLQAARYVSLYLWNRFITKLLKG